MGRTFLWQDLFTTDWCSPWFPLEGQSRVIAYHSNRTANRNAVILMLVIGTRCKVEIGGGFLRAHWPQPRFAMLVILYSPILSVPEAHVKVDNPGRFTMASSRWHCGFRNHYSVSLIGFFFKDSGV